MPKCPLKLYYIHLKYFLKIDNLVKYVNTSILKISLATQPLKH